MALKRKYNVFCAVPTPFWNKGVMLCLCEYGCVTQNVLSLAQQKLDNTQSRMGCTISHLCRCMSFLTSCKLVFVSYHFVTYQYLVLFQISITYMVQIAINNCFGGSQQQKTFKYTMTKPCMQKFYLFL